MSSPRRWLFTAVLMVCFAHLPIAQAVLPTPDGCYPNYTTAEGCNTLNFLTTGAGNTGFGWYSLFSNTTGSFNTGVGGGALALNDGDSNTAVGAAALLLNTTGTQNTAVGTDALVFNDTGSFNTANGAFALFSNTEGSSNTANGSAALYGNTTGGSNTATGYSALLNNTTGSGNTTNGNNSLANNTTGSNNTASGSTSLYNNTTGDANTANGDQALYNNITGSQNTATGLQSLLQNTTGNNNTANGYRAGLNVTGDGNVCIGQGVLGDPGVDNTTWIRNVYTTVQPVVGTDPDNVTVNSDGRLGRANVSSRRYKHDIKFMDKASEALFKLKPVTFRYKEQFDPTQTLAFGLIAEDVAEVYPDLVGRNAEGQPESVRYEQINAMLLNEFLKEHRNVQEQSSRIKEQEATITQLKKDFGATIAQLTARLGEQAAQIQRVSAQIEMAKPAIKVVLDNR